MRRLTARAVPVLLSALTVALLAPGAAPAAPLADPAKPPTARVVVTTPSAPGSPVDVVVRVSRLSKTSPVRITWGDGRTKVLTSTCTARAAARSPLRCAAVAKLTHETPGTYPLTVRVGRNGRVLANRVVTVTAAPAAQPTPSPTPTPTETPTPSAPAATEAWRADMLQQVNALRASVGAGPVAMCAALERAAQKHSEDMASRNYFNHVTPEGVGPGTRINAEGYVGGTWGENIAAGYPDVSAVMTGWINSPGHYANLVNPAFTDIGFGRAESGASTYGTYWTQNFGARGQC